MPVEEDAAVAATLSARLRHVGHVEFEVELEVAESLLGHDVAPADGEDAVGDRPVGGSLAIELDPAVEALAVEQDDRSFGGFGPQRRVVRLLVGRRSDGLRRLRKRSAQEARDASELSIRDFRLDRQAHADSRA